MSLSLGPAKTYGPLLLGGLFASILTGVTTIQTVIYYRLYPQDKKSLKGLVFTVWVLDSIHTSFTWRGMWYYLIENFGDETKMKLIHMSIPATGLLTAIITIIVQGFYVDRIFRLSKHNYWISGPIFILSIARLVAAIAIVTEMFLVKTFPAFEKFNWLLTFALSLSSGVDILITVAMCYLLRESRTHALTFVSLDNLSKSIITISSFPRIHNAIDQIVLYTLEVGTLTSLGAILAMICWTAIPNKLIFLGSLYPVGKLYANSVLAIMNARYQFRQPLAGDSRPSQVRQSINPHFLGLSRSADEPSSFDMRPSQSVQMSLNLDDAVETGSSTSKLRM
ncbi:hypothetical protein M378DRAFT_15096 [Amanita muscaria Koide BX008]|uniref:DUF6534 domain-containing protein n=1 Tax=Amanita muscaria (strain Koide BX008) TaxID=946122 RepID=A0A0C2WRZ0_AMAMK|nr:hypothetical protein M378DRAFT_15096 [Amanita muscaria Koide BX008]